MTKSYPLQWPPHRPRSKHQRSAKFDTSLRQARDGLMNNLRLLGAKNVVLSSNLELRLDGIPYANQREPRDAGIAVYFSYCGKSMCFSCDRWNRVRDNVRAIEKTIEAMRGIERWGTGEMVQAAFSGFEALPSPDAVDDAQHSSWWIVLGVPHDASESDIRAAYKSKARELGGTTVELNAARDAALLACAENV